MLRDLVRQMEITVQPFALGYFSAITGLAVSLSSALDDETGTAVLLWISPFLTSTPAGDYLPGIGHVMDEWFREGPPFRLVRERIG